MSASLRIFLLYAIRKHTPCSDAKIKRPAACQMLKRAPGRPWYNRIATWFKRLRFPPRICWGERQALNLFPDELALEYGQPASRRFQVNRFALPGFGAGFTDNVLDMQIAFDMQ